MSEDGNMERNNHPPEEDAGSCTQHPNEQSPPPEPPSLKTPLQVRKGIGLLLLLHLSLFLVPVAFFFISIVNLYT